jgi:hypothetical protein
MMIRRIPIVLLLARTDNEKKAEKRLSRAKKLIGAQFSAKKLIGAFASGAAKV